MVFPVVMYECENWTVKKGEHWRTDGFELWCWRRRLRVPWTASRSNQLILKEISSEYSLEGLMLKLKLQYFGHLMQRTDSLEKTLMLAKTEGGEGDDREWDGWMASPTWWTWVWVSSGSWWWTGKTGVLQSMGLRRVGHDWMTEPKPSYSSIIVFVFNWSVKTHAKHCKLNQIPFRNRWAATIKHSPGRQTFLVVHWIGICLPMQGTLVRSLVQEDSTCSGAARPMCPKYWSPIT